MLRVLFIMMLCSSLFAQDKMNLLQYLIKSDSSLNFILDQKSRYEPQILYTQINRDENNKVSLTTLKFNVDDKEYFYPASTVKLPAALVALEKLNELNIPGLNKFSRLYIDSGYSGQTRVQFDSTSENKYPSIAHYIKKIFLASDNDAFNRLYEFIGQEYLNKKLHDKGYLSSMITNRLSISLPPHQNRCTNPVSFFDETGKVIYTQPLICNEKEYRSQAKNLYKGIGYIQGDSLVRRPKDFSRSNFISLSDLHKMIISVIYPETIEPDKRFNITNEDYGFIRKYMSMLPRESDYPKYDSSYYDSYVKFFLFGNYKDSIPESIRIFNKIGLAYGYLIDNAYIVDFKNNIEFFLSAVIYVNDDGIFNDDKYEYDTTGIPFIENLGRAVYNYEIIREKKYKSDLSEFIFNYKD